MRFLSHSTSYSILFRDNQADIILAQKSEKQSSSTATQEKTRKRNDLASGSEVIHMRVVGASANARPSGEGLLQGTVNYFTGSDSAGWHTGIPTFAGIDYRSIYHGIDLAYHIEQDKLEFDFRVAPQASPSVIRLRFEGASKINLDSGGNLNVAARLGSIRFHKPSIYQLDADNKRHLVSGSFRLLPDGNLGFNLGPYDHARSLVIDPILDYSTYIGSWSGAQAVAVNSAGEAFVAGYASVGMPTTVGAYQPNFPGGVKTNQYAAGESIMVDSAAFVAKLNASGTALIYCTYLSGSQNDAADAIAVDSQGNAYVAGQTQSTDFPTTAGAYQTKNLSKQGAGFITELNSTGNALLYSSFLSGTLETSINGLAIDSSGDAFVAGNTFDTDFPVTSGAFQTASPVNPIVGGKGFVSKLAASGKQLLYSTYLGGSKLDWVNGIAIDATGNAYVAGVTESPDFPATPGAFQLVNKQGSPDLGTAFVAKLNPTGTALAYSTFLGGSRIESASAIAVDTAGDAYVTGFTASPDFPTTANVVQPQIGVNSYGLFGQDAFVTKFNPAGSGLVYSTYLSSTSEPMNGSAIDSGLGISIDSSGDAYVVGSTFDLDFPVSPGALQTNNLARLVSANYGSFITKLNPAASAILYASYLTGSGNQNGGILDIMGPVCDCANGVVTDQTGNAYVAGYTTSTDFPTTANAFQGQSGFTLDSLAAFVTKFDAAEMQTLPLTTTTVTPSQNPQLAEQPITFTAHVQSSSGSVPTGTVGFTYQGPFFDGQPYAYGPWNDVALDASGNASFTVSSLLSGSIAITAYYLGDSSHGASNGSVAQNITQIPTTTTVTANTTTAPYGTPILFTATVVETATGKPAHGVAIFGIGTLGYAEVTLDTNGQATWTSPTGGPPLPVGNGGIDVNFTGGSAAAPEAQSVGTIAIDITALGVTAAPVIAPAAGAYTSVQSVSLSDTTPGAVIYYTIDGTTPIAGTPPAYTPGTPIQVGTTETVQALAVAPGYTASSIVSAAYVINLPPPDFAITASPTALSVNSGQSATTLITVSPSTGFTQNASLSCSGMPAGVTCQFSPATVAGGGFSTLTVSVAAASAATAASPWKLSYLSTAFALPFCCIPLCRRRLKGFHFTMLAFVAVCMVSGCSGSSSGNSGGSNPAPVTSTLTVNATSGALTHAVTLSLTVTQP